MSQGEDLLYSYRGHGSSDQSTDVEQLSLFWVRPVS